MEIRVYCKHCFKPLGISSISFYRTAYMGELVDGGRKPFCNEQCYNKYLSKYFVEEYKGNKIYWLFKDNKKYYIHYAGCNYGFKTVEECKGRIDAKNVGISF
jgi:hypothetical protein